MAARFKVNRKIGEEMAREPATTRALRTRAERVATNTRRFAVDSRYRSSIRTKVMAPGRIRVGTDYWFAHLDEWGNVNNAPSGAMRRGVQAAGLRLERR